MSGRRVRESWSVGQLLVIGANPKRAEIVAGLPRGMRVALADLARHGLNNSLKKTDEYNTLLGELLNPDTMGGEGD